MFLGLYNFKGDSDVLLEGYEKLLKMMPHENLHLQVCIRNEDGITLYDACPTREIFEAFSTSDDLHQALNGAGFPAPDIQRLGEVHAAFLRGDRVI